MPERLSELAKRMETLEDVPVLMWQDAPASKPRELVWNTQPNYTPEPGINDPLVFPLLKRPDKSNAFAMGITLGRAANNDISIDMPSVSRFHCYFQRDEASGIWFVVDAESFNGTFSEGVRLAPRRPAPMADRVRLRFGTVEMRYLSPAAFASYLRAR